MTFCVHNKEASFAMYSNGNEANNDGYYLYQHVVISGRNGGDNNLDNAEFDD